MKEALQNMDGTTVVPEKELPDMEVKLVNAPENLEDAIKRILELEMRLEDLVRAAEIASITRQMEIIESFAQVANESLKTKIEMVQPSAEDLKVTIITNEKE